MKYSTSRHLFFSLALAASLQADITIHGISTDYQETGGDWLTMGTNDIDGSGGLGTAGYIFYGVFDGLNTSGANGGTHTDYVAASVSSSLPNFVTSHAAGADFAAVADEFDGYGLLDNPNLLDGTDVAGGILLATGGAAGDVREMMTFTVAGLLAGETIRVGILSGVEASTNGRWDPTSITLSDGVNSATVGDHTANPLPENPGGTNTGWVFFDLDADGVYTISATKRLAGQGATISGITFDSAGSVNPDSDNDALLDWWEIQKAGNLTDLTGLNSGPGPGADSGDFDGDGLTDLEEFDLAVTNGIFPTLDPTLADTDSDGFFDAAETNSGAFSSYDFATNVGDTGTNPILNDSDNDGLLDGVESGTNSFVDANNTGSDPNVADSDLDGLEDGFEVTHSGVGYDPNIDDSATDFDNDDSTVAEELVALTDVLLPDTDGDGFYDGAETNDGTFDSYDFVTNRGDTGTDPRNPDTDGDGILDGVESGSGNFVDGSDTGTNPLETDSDLDGFSDRDEVTFGGDPNDSDVQPPNVVNGYTATGGDWLTAFGANDIDGDGALGTDGFIFFGDSSGVQTNNELYTFRVESAILPTYLVSHDQGADFTSVAAAFPTYAMVDNPLTLDGSDQFSGVAVAADGAAGSLQEMMTFEIGALAAGQVVRVGILGGTEGTADGRWDATQITLSGPEGYLMTGINLEANPGGVNAGWLFFDVTSEGVYAISATKRLDVGGAGIGGVTFDSLGGGGDFLNLTIANNPNRTDLDFTWRSRNGVRYNLLSSLDLEGEVFTWEVVQSDLTPSVPNASVSIPRPADPKRFYVIQEVPAP